ncbi:hypothetical protein WKV44_04605 [Spirochaetia bacterium 38H-sp]|uniref:Uncharacterized protein n=1 Tax=Rarispira pelagica TaxID=3141764 RepID=A0ABU9UAY7_9SPIR
MGLFLIVFFILAFLCFPQTSNDSLAVIDSKENTASSADIPTDSTALDDTKKMSLQRGFRGVFLGDDVETVKQRLQKDTLFFYRDSLDVSMNPERDDIIIETSAWKYIKTAHYQFYKGKLALIVLELDTDILDYFGIYRTLTKKYGDAASFSPSVVKWQDEDTIIVLEKPLTVKYIDKKTDDEIRENKQILKSTEDVARDAFLEEF